MPSEAELLADAILQYLRWQRGQADLKEQFRLQRIKKRQNKHGREYGPQNQRYRSATNPDPNSDQRVGPDERTDTY